MPLSEEQMELIILHLENRGVTANCPFCGENSWRPGEIVGARAIDEYANVLRASVPMALMYCRNCSYVASFHAVSVGLMHGYGLA